MNDNSVDPLLSTSPLFRATIPTPPAPPSGARTVRSGSGITRASIALGLLPLLAIVGATILAICYPAAFGSPPDSALKAFVFVSVGVLWLGSLMARLLLAYFDWRTLGRQGFPHRFFWAWSVIGGVYLVGRSVLAFRRSRRLSSLLPMLLTVSTTVISLALCVVQLQLTFHSPGMTSTTVNRLQVSDCFDSSEPIFVAVDIVDCARPHDYEVFHQLRLTTVDWPGEAAVSAASAKGCLPQFELFEGLAYDDSELEVTYLKPTEVSWNSGSGRMVTCVVASPTGKTTGSLRSSRR